MTVSTYLKMWCYNFIYFSQLLTRCVVYELFYVSKVHFFHCLYAYLYT